MIMDKDDRKQAVQLPHQHREIIENRKKARHLELRNATEQAFKKCTSMDALLSMVNQFVDGAEAADLGIGPQGIAVFVNHSGVPVSLHTRSEAFSGIFGSTRMPGVSAQQSPGTDQLPSYSAALCLDNYYCSPPEPVPVSPNGPGSPSAVPLISADSGGKSAARTQDYRKRSSPPSILVNSNDNDEGLSKRRDTQLFPCPSPQSNDLLSPVDRLSPSATFPSLSPSQVPLTHVPLAFRMPRAGNSSSLDPKNVCIVYRLGNEVAKSVLPRVKLSMMEITPEAMEVAPGFRVTRHPQSPDAPVYEIFPSEDFECTVRTYEYQRWYPVKGWSSNLLPTDRANWSDKTGTLARPREFYVLPKLGKWKWANDWTLTEHTADKDHWTYAMDMPGTYGPKTKTSFVRRRMWTRTMSKRMN